MSEMFKRTTPLIETLRTAEDFNGKSRAHTRYQLVGRPRKLGRILIQGSAFVITVDGKNKLQVLPRHSIYIVGGVIKDVFPARQKKVPPEKVDLLYDGAKRGGIVVTPGFINGHAHPPMYLLRSSMTLDKGDIREQVTKMARLESKMRDRDFLIGAVGDFTEEQKNGITTILSHYATFEPIDRAAELTHENVINAISAVSNSHPENTPALVERILKQRKRYYSTPAISIHYLHKASRVELKKIKELVKRYRVLLTMHAAENEEWVQACVEKFGGRTVEALVELGLAGSHTVLSHAVHISDDEVRLIRKHKIGVVHLPTSNKLHKSGEFHYPEFVHAGADRQICLGTDSVISKNSLDLLSEALQTRIMHLDRHRVLYEDLFKMMTSQAAEILKLGRVGRILPGYRADLAFWKLKDRGFLPYNERNPVSLVGNMITHSGRMVRDLMVRGEFIISNRLHNLIDESELLLELQQAHMALRTRLRR